VACYIIFKPFLVIIAIAAVLASVFYKPYEKLSIWLHGRTNLAALLMCLLLMIILIIPAINMLAYAADKSVDAYSETVAYFDTHTLADLANSPVLIKLHLNDFNWEKYNNDTVKNTLLDFVKSASNWLLSGTTGALISTTNFIISLIMIILTMFFFFVDGKNMLNNLMYLSPLPDKYDRAIFMKFREISYTTLVSTFVVAGAQGVVGAVGFAIIGFPVFLAGVLVALLSLLPYIGSAFLYVPVGLYYLLVGKIWQGVFILAWGFLIISTIDNVIRALMLKNKAQVNPIFVVFSVLGGITVFGFWGVVLGPLIVALAATVFHIYSLEFCTEPAKSELETGLVETDDERENREKKESSRLRRIAEKNDKK
jgi:predicted PurR-regulated permease PerM